MGIHQHSQDVDAPAAQLFDYLSDVKNLPHYFSSMTSAEPAEGEAVHVVAEVQAEVHGTPREGEACSVSTATPNGWSEGPRGPTTTAVS